MQAGLAMKHKIVPHDRREIKHAPLPLRGITAAGAFEGYASLFDTADLGRDVVVRGAFADSLRKRGSSGVKMLWQHDASEPIGTWTSIEEDSRGLKVRGQLNLAVARAREILALMRAGAVDGLSIGFRTKKAITDAKTGLRRLQAVDLWEISLVTFPMHPGARVTQVKRAAWPSRRSTDGLGDIARDLLALRWRRNALAVEHVLRKAAPVLERRFSPDQPRDQQGRWTGGGSSESSRDFTPAVGKPGKVFEGGTEPTPTVVSCGDLLNSDLAICTSNIFDDDKYLHGVCMKNMLTRNRECIRGIPLTPLLPY